MFIIKPLSFIVFNMLAGFLIIFSLKIILFIPKKEKRFVGTRIPLTPALIYRKKIWLINKLTKMLKNYIVDTQDESYDSRITKWEQETFHKAFAKLEFISNFKFLPSSLKLQIRHFLATIVYEVTKQFLRSFVPYLMERYNIKQYIELVDLKLDVKILEGYFNRYVFRYLTMFTLSVCFLIGLGNVIIYLIVK